MPTALCAKMSLKGGDMQESIGKSGHRITHLGDTEQDNNAVRLRFANEYFETRQQQMDAKSSSCWGFPRFGCWKSP